VSTDSKKTKEQLKLIHNLVLLTDRDAPSKLVKLLDDKDEIIRASAASALSDYAQRGLTNKAAPSKLVKLLDDKDEAVRSNATGALQKYAERGLTDKNALPKLVKLLEDKHEDVRNHAAQSLSTYAERELTDKNASPKLIELLEDQNEKTREYAIKALKIYTKRGLITVPVKAPTPETPPQDPVEDPKVKMTALKELISKLDEMLDSKKLTKEEYLESYVKYHTQLASIEKQLGQSKKPTTTPRKLKCLFCGSEITNDAETCPNCGKARAKCPVCWNDISPEDRFAKCPYCDTLYHRDHLLEWMKVKGFCPNCQNKLSRKDIN
jgi:uncharacterized Zn-finger protein